MLKSFSKTLPENSDGNENSAEISGTNGINFFCYMYESSLRHPVWVPEINVKACNSVAWRAGTIFYSYSVPGPHKMLKNSSSSTFFYIFFFMLWLHVLNNYIYNFFIEPNDLYTGFTNYRCYPPAFIMEGLFALYVTKLSLKGQ